MLLGPSSPHTTIPDTGSTGHFFALQTPHLLNRRKAHTPLQVSLPDGSTMSSTHIAELHLPQLPKKARTVHLFPALNNTSLLSIGKLCDAGCQATFTADAVTISLTPVLF